jgi:hypothetical protein
MTSAQARRARSCFLMTSVRAQLRGGGRILWPLAARRTLFERVMGGGAEGEGSWLLRVDGESVPRKLYFLFLAGQAKWFSSVANGYTWEAVVVLHVFECYLFDEVL